MKRVGIIAVVCCAIALCFALVGCSGGGQSSSGSSAATDYTKNFTGTYKLVEMSEGEDGGGVIDGDTLESLGLEYTLTINEDKTLAIDFNGETEAGTWEPKDATTMSMKWEENSESDLSGESDGTLDGTTLKLTDSSDAYMTFEKK